jgi:hypothetical protein
MTCLKLGTAALLLALAAAACGRADGIATAQAQRPSLSVVSYPEVAPGAEDGQVYEYH